MTAPGQRSIRINAQWRICFRWEPDGPCDVEIVDYHQEVLEDGCQKRK